MFMKDQSNKAKAAEDYIRYATKQDVHQKQIELDAQGRIKVDQYKSKTINHVELANTFVKLASVVPMHKISRRIIQMKLVNPGISVTGISLQTGLRSNEIKAYETDGINRIVDYMKKTDLQESTDKFNAERVIEAEVKNLNLQGNKNSLLTKGTPTVAPTKESV